MGNNLSKSSFIFNLIDEYQIFSSTGEVNALTDEDFVSFCHKYKTESLKRDSALFQYVTTTPNLFRCHLPYSKWTLAVAFNVVWYYDEIIINDPILDTINSPLPDNEQNKYRLQDLLQFIIRFKESIIGGYILFGGDHIMPNKTDQFLNTSETLINNALVLERFEKQTMLGQKPAPLSSNPEDNLIQLLAKYNGMWGEISTLGMYIPPQFKNFKKLNMGIMYDFTTQYMRLTKDELLLYGKQDLLDGLKKEYTKDITVVLESLTNAQRLNAPVLFYRDVDCVVAKQYALSNSNPNNKLISNTSVYDCALPYMEGIAAEYLFDARTQMPDAFREFRSFLYELVDTTMKTTDNPVEIKFRIDSKITPLQRQLKAEMKNAQRKMNFHGIAAPIVVGLGSLQLYSSGIDYSELMSTLLGTGGAIRSLTTWADVKSDKNKSALNPVYFLWQVKQSRKK